MIRLQQSGKALGSEVALTIIVKNKDLGTSLFQALWAQINAFENQFSRFIEMSELCHFNAHAGDDTKITKGFRGLLATSKEYMSKTDGLYSPFVLPVLQKEGYIGSWPTPNIFNKSLNYSDRSLASKPDEIRIGPKSAQIPYDTAIEFGGIGKGYLLDLLAGFLDTQHVKSYWLSLGGDIICSGKDIEDKPWKITIAHSKNEGSFAGSVSNNAESKLAVATSGITKRKGQDWHHIIDPRTGRSAITNILTATVTADSATEADVYAKCLVILGSEAAHKFIKEHEITAALLQTWDNKAVEIIKYGGSVWA